MIGTKEFVDRRGSNHWMAATRHFKATELFRDRGTYAVSTSMSGHRFVRGWLFEDVTLFVDSAASVRSANEGKKYWIIMQFGDAMLGCSTTAGRAAIARSRSANQHPVSVLNDLEVNLQIPL